MNKEEKLKKQIEDLQEQIIDLCSNEIDKRLKDSLDYEFDLSFNERKELLSYIEQLEKKVDQYENPDDLTLFYMWLDTKAKDKMKQLEKRNKELYEGFMATQEELTDYATKNEQLENNRDKAIEYIANIICDEKARVRHDLCGKDIDGLINILKGDSDE